MAQAGVEDVAQPADVLEVVDVRVPGQRLIAFGTGQRDLDERHAALDQPAGQQASLAELVAAIGVAEPRRLLVQLERAVRPASASASEPRDRHPSGSARSVPGDGS